MPTPSLDAMYTWLLTRVKPLVPQPTIPTGSVNVALNASLAWVGIGAITYDVFFGTTNPPPQVAAGLLVNSFQPPLLTPGTKYYWKIVARNTMGTASGTWNFTTAGVVAAIRVPKGGNLQAALDGAAPGALILVYPDTYPGLILRKKTPGASITIQADTANLRDGQRIDPSALPDLVKLTSPDGSYVVRTDPGASNYTLRGFAPQAFGDGNTAFVGLGDDGETDPLRQPDNVTLDQWLILGDPTHGGRRGVQANTRRIAVLNSHIANLWYWADAQAVGGWNGPGSYLIENCYLESSGENVLFGGGDPKNQSLQPQNLTLRGCTLRKPIAWQGKPGAGIKNGFELKNMVHAVIERNIIEYNWLNAQIGCIILFTVRNQDNTAPYSTIADVIFRNNVVRHAAGFINILGLDATPSVRLTGLKVLGNLFYDLDPLKWGDGAGGWGSGRCIQIQAGPKDVEIAHNTMLSGGDINRSTHVNSFISIGAAGDAFKTENLNVHDNIFPEGDYGLFGDAVGSGRIAFDTYAPGAVLSNNLILRGDSGVTIGYGPQPNVVTAPGETPMRPDFTCAAVVPTTDGTPVGADIAALKAAIPGLDLSQ